jgi:phosphoribosylamine--glycine ligase
VKGIQDFFRADPRLMEVPVIGPSSQAAMLEGSKDFAKQFMQRHAIPTARYQTFERSGYRQGLEFIRSLTPPVVLKADGLAAGKGVIICPSTNEAEEAFNSMLLEQQFGEASRKVVIEEFLSGIELSVFILTDGTNYLILPEAKDYKRIGEGDTGPNTGGMGSISPVPFATPEFMTRVEEQIIKPTINGLKADGIDYTGFIFFGLMNVDGNPYVIEYNCRLGDPETESVLPRVSGDLVSLFKAVASKTLDRETVSFSPVHVAKIIIGEKVKESLYFHAGTALDPVSGDILTSGGRVMAITSTGNTQAEALQSAYAATEAIRFDGKTLRKDIGFDL